MSNSYSVSCESCGWKEDGSSEGLVEAAAVGHGYDSGHADFDFGGEAE